MKLYTGNQYNERKRVFLQACRLAQLSVCTSVSLSVRWVNCGKTADWKWGPDNWLGVWSPSPSRWTSPACCRWPAGEGCRQLAELLASSVVDVRCIGVVVVSVWFTRWRRCRRRRRRNAAVATRQLSAAVATTNTTSPNLTPIKHVLQWPPVIYSHAIYILPSVFWRYWLGGRKGIRPVKNWVAGCWRGYVYAARWRFAYGPDDATATHCLLLR